jgi:hypothetical protein
MTELAVVRLDRVVPVTLLFVLLVVCVARGLRAESSSRHAA